MLTDAAGRNAAVRTRRHVKQKREKSTYLVSFSRVDRMAKNTPPDVFLTLFADGRGLATLPCAIRRITKGRAGCPSASSKPSFPGERASSRNETIVSKDRAQRAPPSRAPSVGAGSFAKETRSPAGGAAVEGGAPSPPRPSEDARLRAALSPAMDNRFAVRVPFGWLQRGGDGAPPSSVDRQCGEVSG